MERADHRNAERMEDGSRPGREQPRGDSDFVNAADDDYLLTNASPALNRGDPSLSYINKPISATTGNGDRIDIGAQGNTDQANPSPSQLIQLLGATGGQRYQVGQAATISFRSAGLAALDPVIFINAGGGKAQGAESWNAWQANEFDDVVGSVSSASGSVSADGLDVPQAVLQNMSTYYSLAAGASSPTTIYQVPVSAGAYQVSLIFVDNSSTGIGQRVFDVFANGKKEASNYDVYKAAGGANSATELTFDVTATAGQGIALAMQAIAGSPILSGIQISRINPSPSTWTASAQVSCNNGQSWTTIATGLALDSHGAGSFSFTPTSTTTTGLLKIVATNGKQAVSDESQGAFMSAPAGAEFLRQHNRE